MPDTEDQTVTTPKRIDTAAAAGTHDVPAQDPAPTETEAVVEIESAPAEADTAKPVADPTPVAAPKKQTEPQRAAVKKSSGSSQAQPVRKQAHSVGKQGATAIKRKSAAPAKAPLRKSLSKPTITELKEQIMQTQNPDYSNMVSDAVTEMQSRAKTTFEKSTEVAGEFTELAKGNAEAVVESGKVIAKGVQDLGKTYVEEAKTAYETITTDLKEMAAVKSPTELFQLQSRLMRRNFDTLVAHSSKNSEAVLKLANEALAPISGRLSLAADRMAKIG